MNRLDVKAPTLKELKTRECSKEELQAALVKFIELHNGLNATLNDMIDGGRIRSRTETLMNVTYGL